MSKRILVQWFRHLSLLKKSKQFRVVRSIKPIAPLVFTSRRGVASEVCFKYYLLGFASYLIVVSSNAFAQVDAGALQQGLERQLPSLSPLALPEIGATRSVEPSAPPKNEVSFTVSRFVLEGVHSLPEVEVQNTISAWLNTPVSFGDLKKACDAIQNFYRSRGLTVQAIVPPQTVKDGVVRILITEAKLGKVIVETPNGQTRFSKGRAASYITYANPIDKPLNMDSLQRAIIILNETPGVLASAQLGPGANKGDVDLNINLTQPDLLQGRVEVNNYGSRTTGANQAVVSLNLNGPLGLGDLASVSAVSSEGSQYVQGLISLPGSENGLRFGLTSSYLQYKNVSNYATNGGSGDAWIAGVSAAYPLLRKAGANINASLNYDIKSYNNINTATSTVTSAYNINNLSAGITGNLVDNLFGSPAVSAGSVNLVFGHLQMLATSPTSYGAYEIPNSSPTAYAPVTPSNFAKAVFAGSRNQQLFGEDITSLYASLSGQFASVNLNSAEQFYLGGPYGVRAYPLSQSGGTQGGLFSFEVRHKLQTKLMVYGFYDAGVVQQYKALYPDWQGLTNANNTYSLMGAGLGFRWDYVGWNIGAMVAWKIGSNPLYSSTGQPVNTDGSTTQPRGWATASYAF